MQGSPAIRTGFAPTAPRTNHPILAERERTQEVQQILHPRWAQGNWTFGSGWWPLNRRCCATGSPASGLSSVRQEAKRAA